MKTITITLISLLLSQTMYAKPIQISNTSTFAVLTLKKGIASALAHNHIIVANKWDAQVDYDQENRKLQKFEIQIPIETLEIDNPQHHDSLYPALKILIPKEEKFAKLSDADRKKVRESMLSEEQLNGAKEKLITAKVIELVPKNSSYQGREFNMIAKTEITIKGVTKTYDAPTELTEANGIIRAESILPLKFTDFNIKPYSAFLGAVGNRDDFYIYTNVAVH